MCAIFCMPHISGIIRCSSFSSWLTSLSMIISGPTQIGAHLVPFHGWVAFYCVCVSHPLWLPRWPSGKESPCQCWRCRKHGLNLWVRNIPGSRKRLPTPVSLPGKFHGQRKRGGLRFTRSQRVGMAEWLSSHAHHTFMHLSVHRRLGCYHVLAIVSNVAMNMCLFEL